MTATLCLEYGFVVISCFNIDVGFRAELLAEMTFQLVWLLPSPSASACYSSVLIMFKLMSVTDPAHKEDIK